MSAVIMSDGSNWSSFSLLWLQAYIEPLGGIQCVFTGIWCRHINHSRLSASNSPKTGPAKRKSTLPPSGKETHIPGNPVNVDLWHIYHQQQRNNVELGRVTLLERRHKTKLHGSCVFVSQHVWCLNKSGREGSSARKGVPTRQLWLKKK